MVPRSAGRDPRPQPWSLRLITLPLPVTLEGKGKAWAHVASCGGPRVYDPLDKGPACLVQGRMQPYPAPPGQMGNLS